MFCNNCGKFVENGAVFCTNCGKKMETPPAVTEAEQAAEAAAQESVPVQENMPVQEAVPANEAPRTEQSLGGAYENTTYVPPVMPEVNNYMNEKEKTCFGKGALIFCLVIIGLLSISTGIFAGLYFSLV